jgi:hypothetical protein
MSKIFETWVAEPVPGKVYAEIKDGMFKYGFAPGGIEMSITEYPVTTIYNDQEIWLSGNEWAGIRIAFRDVGDNCATVKLQTFIAKHRNTIAEERVYW